MNVYMLKGTFKDGETQYYRRTKGLGGARWVTQKEGSIWISQRGPAAAKSRVDTYYDSRKRSKRPTLEIEEFILITPSRHIESGTLELVKVSFAPETDGVSALYIRGKLHIYGDCCHGHIDDTIDGIVAGAQLFFPDIVLEEFYVTIDECKDICRDHPPDTFAACLEQFPVTSEYPA